MTYIVYRHKNGSLAVLAPVKLTTIVTYSMLDTSDEKYSLKTRDLPKTYFLNDFSRTSVKDYPPEKLAQIQLQYARTTGATPQALKILETLITITEKDKIMANKPKTTTTKKPATKKPTMKKSTSKTTTKKPATKKPYVKKAAAEKAAKRPSAAQRFKELLMKKGKDGKCEYTDDKIFDMVQKEFDLDDKKRTYVAWYRNDLTKKGQKPPAAKAAK